MVRNMTDNTAALLSRFTRKKLLLVPALLFVLFVFAPVAEGIEIEKEAKILEDAIKAGERIPLSTLDDAEKTEA